MRVAALQFDVQHDVSANLRAVEQGLRDAAERGIALVVLPEMWATSFADPKADLLTRNDEALAQLASWSRELELVVCGTAFARAEGGRFPFNRLSIFDRGEEVLAYDKVHLFTPTAEHTMFSAGKEAPATAATSCGRVAGVTCYDLRFPEITRVPFAEGAEILVVPAQWPSPRAAHWVALARARAVENQCFVIAGNRTGTTWIGKNRRELVFPGNSLVVDPHGELLAQGEGEPGLVEAEVDFEVARRIRIRVPIEKDVRPDLYHAWSERSNRPS